MNDSSKNLRYAINLILGFVIGFVVFVVMVISYIIVNSLGNINGLVSSLPFIIIILPVMLLAMLMMYFYFTVINLEFLINFIWEFLFIIGMGAFYYYKDRISEKAQLLVMAMIVTVSLVPFIYLQIFGLPPFMSNGLTLVYNWFNFPREQGIIRFVQVYWGIPIWFISWMNLWIVKLPQVIVQRQKPNIPQWISLMWVVAISIILLLNKVHLIMYIP